MRVRLLAAAAVLMVTAGCGLLGGGDDKASGTAPVAVEPVATGSPAEETGLMQLMPDTVDMINSRFGLSYDVSGYQQNATAGANYLAWLTRYMSLRQFAEKTYDLSPAKCRTHSSWCLLNLVISAYQAGPDAVLQNAKSKKLPNPEYVDSVRSLMSSCYCDRY